MRKQEIILAVLSVLLMAVLITLFVMERRYPEGGVQLIQNILPEFLR